MPEPITLAVVSGLVLTEGIKFLYGQANELLKGWRARRDAKKDASAPVPSLPALAAPPPNVLDAPVDAGRPADEEVVGKLESDLDSAKKALAKYTHPEDPAPVDPDDEELREEVDRLRRLLESVYGQRLTFAGENREPTGTTMTVQMKLANIEDSDVVGIEGAEQAGAGSNLAANVTADGLKRSSATGISFGPRLPSARPATEADR